ncbi:Asp-tRNA(Asn)/Glu-tRNA(Gln) amidotransferase A subunit family amidase [Paraburkholderia sp. BL18I3N2]|uniref:amidase n=1 Tax=unclassified Paraburkholderia TaxID=2615204 RepID=UPI000D06CFC3|nr:MULTISPECIES: amidase [unclassified Paraburkholderia]PRX19196.1 Asp-tRNA(Asn)/Glu-tRNA(Gln) amidotransferase A subunit family amidase [Paraburkholderia sp. BL18I3N2]PRX89422.1 Asp-tRNA(Asn)/Glu-tRNA(Gln) amidotransferase A subunit family amidase [Paraburkholderia sp. BL25I1N1]
MIDWRLSAASIRRLQAEQTDGTLSARQLVDLYLKRITAFDQSAPAINAIATINERATAEADALDAERRDGVLRGALHGIPVLIKDNIETAGLQTTAGCTLLAGWKPEIDAAVVRRLRQAGAIILAKTNMHEFGYGIRGFGSYFGQVRNPYDPECYPGGSSSGSAAGLAAGFGAVALGTDTSGSIGVPSAYNGLVGLRVTQGLISCEGIVPLSSTQDVVGPIARTVEDAATVLDVLTGTDVGGVQAPTFPLAMTYTAALGTAELRNVRIGRLTDLFRIDAGDDEVAGIVERRLDLIETAGTTIVDVEISALSDLLKDRLCGSLVLVQDFKFDLDEYLARRPTSPLRSFQALLASGVCHAAVIDNLRLSMATVSRVTQEYYAHVAKRRMLREVIVKAMDQLGLDALVFPTIRQPAGRIGGPQNGANSQLSANSGLPALTLPSGYADGGVPVGMDILGRPWRESRLLAIGHAIEQCTPPPSPPALTFRDAPIDASTSAGRN